MGKAVLHGVHRLADAHVVRWQTSVDVSPQCQVERQGLPHGWVRRAVGVEPVERFRHPPANEVPAIVDRCLRSARFVLRRAAKAVLVLVVGVSVDLRQEAEVVRRPSLEVVVADTHQQGRGAEVLHVLSRSELQIADEGAFVVRRRDRRALRKLEADRPERFGREAFVTPRSEDRRDRIGTRRTSDGDEADQESAWDSSHTATLCTAGATLEHRRTVMNSEACLESAESPNRIEGRASDAIGPGGADAHPRASRCSVSRPGAGPAEW